MALIFRPSSPTLTPSRLNNELNSSSNLNYNFKLLQYRAPWKRISPLTPKSSTIPKYYRPKSRNFTCRGSMSMNPNIENTIDFEMGQSGDEGLGSPWVGAVVFMRNPSVSHVEYCTTLERLGLGKLSTEVSKSRASEMGLRVTKAVKDYPLGTPVQISIDVTRKKQRLRLDGIIRTVLTLGCNRCGEPTAKSVFSNFTLLLTEEPIEESDVINMGVIFGDHKSKTSAGTSGDEENDEATIDLDDQLYFPAEEKEKDISKHIRDMVHVEITIDAICDSRCKGLCLRCGTNLNTTSCNCCKHEVKEKSYGPLGNLRNQMQPKCS